MLTSSGMRVRNRLVLDPRGPVTDFRRICVVMLSMQVSTWRLAAEQAATVAEKAQQQVSMSFMYPNERKDSVIRYALLRLSGRVLNSFFCVPIRPSSWRDGCPRRRIKVGPRPWSVRPNCTS